MEIIFVFLLCSRMVIADLIDMHGKDNSPHLKGKIFKGEPAWQEEHKYMASLQLDGDHICSSCMIKAGIILTTADCASFIHDGMETKSKKGTAVFGHYHLENGIRTKIIRIMFNTLFRVRGSNVGVVKLEDDVDYTHINFLPLYQPSNYSRLHGLGAVVCGWGTVAIDEGETHEIETADNSNTLHCMSVTLYGRDICNAAIPPGNFRTKLICGLGNHKLPVTSLGDLGSPLTKVVEEDGEEINYIIGLTLRRFDSQRGTWLRFFKTSFAYFDIQIFIEQLEQATSKNSTCSESSDRKLSNKPSKRRKIQP